LPCPSMKTSLTKSKVICGNRTLPNLKSSRRLHYANYSAKRFSPTRVGRRSELPLRNQTKSDGLACHELAGLNYLRYRPTQRRSKVGTTPSVLTRCLLGSE